MGVRPMGFVENNKASHVWKGDQTPFKHGKGESCQLCLENFYIQIIALKTTAKKGLPRKNTIDMR